jgi:hypothetical protein
MRSCMQVTIKVRMVHSGTEGTEDEMLTMVVAVVDGGEVREGRDGVDLGEEEAVTVQSAYL